MSTLLTAKWKKSIVPKLVNDICVWFNPVEFDRTIVSIINTLSAQHLEPFNHLEFRGEIFRITGGSNRASTCRIGTTSKHYNLMYHLIANRDSVKECSRELTAYLQNGLAICHTLECIEQVFPEFILERINSFTALLHQKLVTKPTTNPKHIKFIEQYAHVVGNIKQQLIINSLVSEPSHAKPNLQ